MITLQSVTLQAVDRCVVLSVRVALFFCITWYKNNNNYRSQHSVIVAIVEVVSADCSRKRVMIVLVNDYVNSLMR